MNIKSSAMVLLMCGFAGAAQAVPLQLTAEGKPLAVIVVDPGAPEVEQTAAAELVDALKKVTGATFMTSGIISGTQANIAVGPGAAKQLDPKLDLGLQGLGHEGVVVRCDGRNLILAGAVGARRGTLYAVYTFLTDTVGCRWWTPGATTFPRKAELHIPMVDLRQEPAFEYRESYIAHTVDGEWAARNRVNGHFYRIADRLGGHVAYRGYKGKWGFVHTFNTIVPPEEFFPKHPTWFSEIGGKRIAPPAHSQLCLTNAELLEFVKGRVRELLSTSPADSIVEVSQNDWQSRCQCAKCLAVEKEEGSPSGPLLRFVNAIAQHIEGDFPDAAISTLAYQYTRKPPKQTRPRPNVCIRLCSIECSFLQPLEHPANKAFADDIRRWSELTNRLYVWDYVTNFSLPLQPHPNLRVLAPNIRFFRKHGVKGVFEEGGHYTQGAAFSDIRAWVLARLLWNPDLDGDALVQEFTKGYYEDAAPHVLAYINLLHDVAENTGSHMPCFDRKSAFLTFDLLMKAEDLFSKAEKAVDSKPDVLKRVELAHASVWHAIIIRWPWLKRQQLIGGEKTWFPQSRGAYCEAYVRVCREHGVAETHIAPWENMRDRPEAVPPKLVSGLAPDHWLDLQDELFALHRAGTWVEYADDPSASDGVAARMPATHRQWAVQCGVPFGDALANRNWAVYVAVKVEPAGTGEGLAFSAGVYDVRQRRSLGHLEVPMAEASAFGGYRFYRIEGARVSPDVYIWVAPAKNPELVKNIWVDRVLLVLEDE
ncbi:MAG: DUF4838 domain-containing protein [Lentisphaeria bacterium]|nr:DUF4838 domain-containing protein [Lentisphaeria bacterium]